MNNTRKRINLFGKASKKDLATLLSEKAVLYATIIGVIIFIVFLISLGYTFYQKSRIQSLLSEKESLLNYVVQNKDTTTDTTYFLLKKEQLKNFLKDDAQFLPYYTILKNSLPAASSSAQVETLTIDKSRKSEFTINFSDYEAMYKYIKYIESQEFLQHFDSLQLTTFSLNLTGTGQNKGYTLFFEGKFKQITDNSFS